jgi:hypothetical protein
MVTFAAGMAAESVQNPFFALMTKAVAHARAHHCRYTPALSPMKESLLGERPAIDVEQMHRAGFLVVPWTHTELRLPHAASGGGAVFDDPDLLPDGISGRAQERTGSHRAEVVAADAKW